MINARSAQKGTTVPRLRLLLPMAAAGVLLRSGCGDRSGEDTAEDFVEAFNDGALADQDGLFAEAPSAGQLKVLGDLADRCTIDDGSVEVVDNRVASYNQTMGAIAECDGEKYSVITGLVKDEQGEDMQVDPAGLPGASGVGKVKSDELSDEINELPPLGR